MKEISMSAVIGMNYGDEGKGHIVDWLCSKDGAHGLQTLVVRFNGGAQAGHTVVTPDGRRHVHHHFGSGSMLGSMTFLSRYFIVNPALFRPEYETLKNMGTAPVVFVDGLSQVTTPWDMMLNQAAESVRDTNRHGSCGVGINETITRSSRGFWLWTYDLFLRPRDELRKKLLEIRRDYVPMRAVELAVDLAMMPLLWHDELIERFLDDCEFFKSITKMMDWCRPAVEHFDQIVFEGAQGLRLDEHAPDFPHVTRSRTGLTNVLLMVNEIGWPEFLHAYYVTRPYLTRHGAGPLPNESNVPYKIVDDTNVDHQWQGRLRAADLDLNTCADFVSKDLNQADAYEDAAVFPHVAVTCLDQIPGGVWFYKDKKLILGSELQLCENLLRSIGRGTIASGLIGANGLTRDQVFESISPRFTNHH